MAPLFTVSSGPKPKRCDQGGLLPFTPEGPARPMDRSAGPR